MSIPNRAKLFRVDFYRFAINAEAGHAFFLFLLRHTAAVCSSSKSSRTSIRFEQKHIRHMRKEERRDTTAMLKRRRKEGKVFKEKVM